MLIKKKACRASGDSKNYLVSQRSLAIYNLSLTYSASSGNIYRQLYIYNPYHFLLFLEDLVDIKEFSLSNRRQHA